jgi:hypothetical protein
VRELPLQSPVRALLLMIVDLRSGELATDE